ncbi:MAG TPA: c-type cytochrome [Gaiellaceae bacterium]|jgi:mono/diheme cytochrome c family protein
MAEDRVAERRKVFKQYKEDVKERGKPFYPYAMLHDTIMSLFVVAVIIALAIVWKWSIPGDHANTGSGLLGKLYDEPADPGTFNFVPRPDWYFYFLFYLLRVFKWPSTVILGTVGIPTILLILLMSMPFLDLRVERNPLRRPVALVASILVVLSMGILTYKGAAAKESLGSELVTKIPEWGKAEGFTGNKEAIRGATLFASVGCANCHTYNGAGSSNLGAPDLTDEGSRRKGVAFQIAHLKDPAGVNAGSPMPSFASQGAANLKALATFLEASKGQASKGDK